MNKQDYQEWFINNLIALISAEKSLWMAGKINKMDLDKIQRFILENHPDDDRHVAWIPVSLDEMGHLVRYNESLVTNIPERLHDVKNKAGTTMGEVVAKYKKRAQELYQILNEVWPK